MDGVQQQQQQHGHYRHLHSPDDLLAQHTSDIFAGGGGGFGQSQAFLWLATAALTGSVVIVFLSIACCGSRKGRPGRSLRGGGGRGKEEVEEGNADDVDGGGEDDDDDDEPLHYTMVFVARQPSRTGGDGVEAVASGHVQSTGVVD